MTATAANDPAGGVLDAKDSLEMLLKLSADAAGHARHAETTHNQLLTLFLSVLGAFVIVRNANALGFDERVRWQIENSLLIVMAYLSITSFHRALVAIDEREISESYRITFKVWLARLNPQMVAAIDLVDRIAKKPSRTRIIDIFRNVTNGIVVSVSMILATILLLTSFYIHRS